MPRGRGPSKANSHGWPCHDLVRASRLNPLICVINVSSCLLGVRGLYTTRTPAQKPLQAYATAKVAYATTTHLADYYAIVGCSIPVCCAKYNLVLAALAQELNLCSTSHVKRAMPSTLLHESRPFIPHLRNARKDPGVGHALAANASS